MVGQPLILCPIDFSEPSRGALRYAAAVAEHFEANLLVLTVDDPFLRDAAAAAFDEGFLERQTREALSEFVEATFPESERRIPQLSQRIATGRPESEILRCAEETQADLIVMSTHGKTGINKAVFGSVTERVLRRTFVPVLITPAADAGPESPDAWQARLKRILVPVDFSDWTPQQVTIASRLGEALRSELLFLHVVASRSQLSFADVHEKLDRLTHDVPPSLRPETIVCNGEPAPEIARIAREREANLIVMGLHSSRGRRQHMGRITYALLCQAPVLVLAWPPERPGTIVVTKRSGTTASDAAAERRQAMMEDPFAELERELIRAYLAGAGHDFNELAGRDDEEAKRLLAAASEYASTKLSEVEARLHYLRSLQGQV